MRSKTQEPKQSPTVAKTTRSYEKKLPASQEVNVVDFFCGCGGMSSGFITTRQSHLSFRILAGIDIDENALGTYAHNIGVPALPLDIRELAADPERLIDLVPDLADEDSPLVFLGCPPCQGFSAHRKKDRRIDPRNDLIVAFAEVSAYFVPDLVVMENVPEVINGRHSHHFDQAVQLLQGSGYTIDAKILDFSQFGLPQRRKRAVAIAAFGEAKFPRPPHVFRERPVSVRDAISHLRPIAAGSADAEDPWHRAPAHTERILRRIEATPPDGGDRRSLPASEQLSCHSAVDVSETPGFTDVYGRLRWDQPSVTITAKSSTPSCGRFLHPEQHRNISLREAAILQGFPQDFEFRGPFVNQYRQVGEAVPPLIARWLAHSVLDSLRPAARPPRYSKKPASKEDGVPVGVDAFCGSGGMSVGLQNAGIQPVFAFDLDEDAVNSYRQNIDDEAAVLDIRSLQTAASVDEAVDGRTWILAGGPPCQGFSQQRRGDDEDGRNVLVVELAELAARAASLPSAVILENVTYLDSPRGREVLSQYVASMENLGYRTFRHDLNSADFGVPQLRKRIFVVSLLPEYAAEYGGPRPTTPNRWVSVGEALEGLPEVAQDGEEVPNHAASGERAINRRRIAFVGMGGGRLAIPEEFQLECHRKYGGHLDVYGRLDWFGFARTLTGGFDSFTRGEYAHPFRHRSITAREAATIQGFRSDFRFVGNRASVRRQIGNAVPPPMAAAVGAGVRAAVTGRARLRLAA
jgi:DNA (cytosine-5)-methyltransferase 1